LLVVCFGQDHQQTTGHLTNCGSQWRHLRPKRSFELATRIVRSEIETGHQPLSGADVRFCLYSEAGLDPQLPVVTERFRWLLAIYKGRSRFRSSGRSSAIAAGR
jgi:hypothetical protein